MVLQEPAPRMPFRHYAGDQFQLRSGLVHLGRDLVSFEAGLVLPEVQSCMRALRLQAGADGRVGRPEEKLLRWTGRLTAGWLSHSGFWHSAGVWVGEHGQ